MDNQQKDTEIKILDAAKEVFQQKGMTGARMQEIADKAGINKSLLHYYYRSKEKLFEKVFNMAVSIFIPKMLEIMLSEKPLFEKLEFFINNYIDLLTKHPYIPGFVINELNRNPQFLLNIFEKNVQIKEKKLFERVDVQIQEEVKKGILNPIDTRHLITNVIALVVFPMVARPIIQGVMFENDKKQYDSFLKERKAFVLSFVINSIKV
ncbi:MAG: TetR family transcriptional regulator [Bacteroidales bacterium]|nr:TetR family transcriptional regulator [Bacteroidales bacterium]